MTHSNFTTLGVAEPLRRALAAENYSEPTPIQTQTIPLILAGSDVLGIAQTGTGKTAAFGLPLLQMLAANRVAPVALSPRALILAPTRELAIQIDQSLRVYGRNVKLRHAVIVGGVNQNRQVQALRQGVDILVATPGRLLDLIQQKHVRLGSVTALVIDEADRMFDMGFIRDVRRIVRPGAQRLGRAYFRTRPKYWNAVCANLSVILGKPADSETISLGSAERRGSSSIRPIICVRPVSASRAEGAWPIASSCASTGRRISSSAMASNKAVLLSK